MYFPQYLCIPVFVYSPCYSSYLSNSANIKMNTWKLRGLKWCLSQVLPIYLPPIHTQVIGKSTIFWVSSWGWYIHKSLLHTIHNKTITEKNPMLFAKRVILQILLWFPYVTVLSRIFIQQIKFKCIAIPFPVTNICLQYSSVKLRLW